MNENRFTELKENVAGWMVACDMQKRQAYAGQIGEEERNRIIEEANLIMKQTIVFRNVWGQETGRAAHRKDEEMWVHHLKENPQWTYALNRHEFLYTLLYAYQLTGQKMYAEKLRWCIFDWMIKNPIVLSGTETTRPADTGVRCLNWCDLILHMIAEEAIDEEDTVVYLQNMGMQFEYLRRKYAGSNTISSDGVPQTAAICAAYLWFSEFLSGEDQLEQWAWRELKQQLELQILDDGSHREDAALCDGQAGEAHGKVLDVCEKLLLHCQKAKKAEVKLCPEAQAAMEPGTGWLWNAVEHMSRYLVYLEDAEHRYDSLLRRAAAVISQETAEENASLQSVRQSGGLYLSGADSGKLHIRSDWSEQADYTWMGRVTGRMNEDETDDGNFELIREANPYVRENHGTYYGEMSAYGVMPDKAPCFHTGRMLVLPGGIWVFGQQLECRAGESQGAGNVGEYFDLHVQKQEHGHSWTVTSGSVMAKLSSQKPLELKMVEKERLAVLAPADVEVKRAAVFQFGRPAPIAKSLVTALDLKLPTGESWTVIIWDGDMKKGSQMFLCHGVPICGRVAVLCGKNGGFERILLKN